MLRPFRRRRPKREKILDPALHAGQFDQGPFLLLQRAAPWAPFAVHYTTSGHFSRAGGIQWYNNCGPTALTNLLSMYRRRCCLPAESEALARSLYFDTASYGTRHLFFINANNRYAHGTSDLRAGTYIRRVFRRLFHVRPRVRLRRVTERNIMRSIDRGALLYLLLWGHPEYGSHHLTGYGYSLLKSQATGADRMYIQVCDGHAAAPRYLDMEDFHGRLRFYYEVRFPWLPTPEEQNSK